MLILQPSSPFFRFRSAVPRLTWSDAKSTSEVPLDAPFAASCLRVATQLISNLSNLWLGLPSYREIFAFSADFLSRLDEGRVPKELWKEVEGLRERLEKSRSEAKKKPISVEKKKPKILKLYEPEIEDK